MIDRGRTRKPRLVGGVKGLNIIKTIPYREAPPYGRRASQSGKFQDKYVVKRKMKSSVLQLLKWLRDSVETIDRERTRKPRPVGGELHRERK